MASRSRRSDLIQIALGPNSRTTRGTAALQDLLTELAVVLLPRGMTPKRFGQLARSAFVQAAAGISKLQNGRVNYSRVAAQTGLTRADVTRLLRHKVVDAEARGQTAVERVIGGWRADREFVIKPGVPKHLPITGRRGSFVHLVKKYGGDLPHRAVLHELRRIGAVREIDGKVEPRRSLHLRQRNNFAFLSPVLPALADLLSISCKKATSKAPPIQRLIIPVETEIDLAIVRERSASSAQSMLDGLAHSLGTQVTVPKSRRAPRYSFTVTIVLAEGPVSKTQRTL
jgi:hypothetical protein